MMRRSVFAGIVAAAILMPGASGQDRNDTHAMAVRLIEQIKAELTTAVDTSQDSDIDAEMLGKIAMWGYDFGVSAGSIVSLSVDASDDEKDQLCKSYRRFLRTEVWKPLEKLSDENAAVYGDIGAAVMIPALSAQRTLDTMNTDCDLFAEDD